ncbi:MAG: YihY/virulence factor BrkB family protein [Acidobacteriaceae bacterium]|nr:YihY/virulence factor BrkB family protein [Acidobacteriaceae bacterium]
MFLKRQLSLLKDTYSRWSEHNAPRLGASVAFYSILSFAPLLVLATAIIGFVFGHENAHGALVSEARQLIGDRGAETAESLLKSADKPATGTFASIIAFVTLLFGASGVFTELQAALNVMWDAPKKQSSGLMSLIKERLFSFGMVLSVGFLLLVSLLLSSALGFIGHSFGQLLPLPAFVLQILNFALSFVVVTVLFALMLKYLPDVAISWRQVIVGAIGTALLFTIGKFLLAIYLSKAGVGSTYGAAGSLVAVVVWIYYSAQIFFFGAEYTRVHAGAIAKEPAHSPHEDNSEAARESRPAAPAKGDGAVAAVGATPRMEPSGAVALRASSQSMPVPSPQNAMKGARLGEPQAASEMQSVAQVSARNRPQRVKKPRLVAAVAIGFLLGRITLPLATRRSRS